MADIENCTRILGKLEGKDTRFKPFLEAIIATGECKAAGIATGTSSPVNVLSRLTRKYPAEDSGEKTPDSKSRKGKLKSLLRKMEKIADTSRSPMAQIQAIKYLSEIEREIRGEGIANAARPSIGVSVVVSDRQTFDDILSGGRYDTDESEAEKPQ